MAELDWERVKELFEAALAVPNSRREAWLAESCGGEEALRAEVESLLKSFEEAPAFLEAPAAVTFDAPVADDPARSLLGRQIGPYRLESLIASGGMGSVFLGSRTEDFEQKVAVKFLRRGFDTGESLQRFLNERQTLANLRHPNIAGILDGGTTEDGLSFLVMEYVDGQPVDVYCESQRLRLRARLSLFLKISSAVQEAHRNLVVHRDLKPGNILVMAGGEPKLLDFGIARILDPDFTGTETGLTVAPLMWLTPDYASPEQVRGEPVTTATDIYSLGVILYELLTGTKPYRVEGRTRIEMERTVAEQQPVLPSRAAGVTDTRRRALRGDLDAIVMMALRKEPGRRYASASDLAEDLRRHLQGQPVRARPDTFGYRAGKFLRRNRLAVGAGSLLGLAILGGALTTAWQARRAARKALTTARTSGILLRAFERANPYNTPGEVITAAQVLRSSATELFSDESLREEPEVRAELGLGIGRAFLGLSEDSQAVAALREALADAEAAGKDLEQAAVLHQLAIALRRLGQLDEAARRIGDCLDIRRRIVPPADPEYIGALNVRGTVLLQAGRQDEARAALEEARAAAVAALRTPGDVQQALQRTHFKILSNLGTVSQSQGLYEDAVARYEEALTLVRSLDGPRHPETATTLNNLGMARLGRGDIPGARRDLDESLAIRREALPAGHPLIAASLNNLAQVLYQEGDLEGARRRFEEALEALLRRAPEHPEVLITRSNLAATLQALGDHRAAEAQFREVLRLRRASLSPEHPDLALSLMLLGEHLLELSEDAAGAEALLEEASGILNQLNPDGSWDTAYTDFLLGRAQAELGRRTQAREALARALAVFQQIGAQDDARAVQEALDALDAGG